MTERQLDVWAELVYREIDKAKEAQDKISIEENLYKYGKLEGIGDGLAMALTLLSIVVEGKRFKKVIAEIEEKLDKEDSEQNRFKG